MMISKKDRYHIDTVMAHALSTDKVAGARIGAMMVIKGKPISFGINKRKSHPLQAKYGKNSKAIYLHSEIDCTVKALRRVDAKELNKATLYIARVKKSHAENGDDIWGLAKPCRGCLSAINAFKIKRVIYTTNEQTLEVLEK